MSAAINWYKQLVVKETISEYCKNRLIQLGASPILRRYDENHRPYFNPSPEDVTEWIEKANLTGVLASITTVTKFVAEQKIKAIRPHLISVDLVFDLDCNEAITLEQMKALAKIIVQSLKEIGLGEACYLTNSRRTQNRFHVIVPGNAIKGIPGVLQDELVKAIGNWCLERVFEIISEKPDLQVLVARTKEKDASVTISCFSDLTRPFPVPLSLYWKPKYEKDTFICPFPPDQIDNYEPSWADVNNPNFDFKDCWRVEEVELSDKIVSILLKSREREFIEAETIGWETPRNLDIDIIRETIKNEKYEAVFCPALTKALKFPFGVGHRRPILSLLLAELKGFGFENKEIIDILTKRNSTFLEPHPDDELRTFLKMEMKRYGEYFGPPGCKVIRHGGGALWDGLQALNLCDGCPYVDQVTHPIWATMKFKQSYTPIRVFDLYRNIGTYVNRKIEVDLTPQIIISGKTAPTRVKWECTKCGRTEVQKLKSPSDRALSAFHPPKNWCDCPERYWRHSVLSVCSLFVISGIDPLEKVKDEAAVDRKPVNVYYPTEEPWVNVWGNLKIRGTLKRIPSKGKITETVIVADSVEPIEEAEFTATEEDLKEFAKHYTFQTRDDMIDKLDNTIAPWIRGRPLPKVFAALAMHTPLFLLMPSGVKELKYELGVGRIVIIGEERTGKGDTITDVLSLCPQPSELISGETAGRTGLVYMIQQTPEGEWEVLWRAIPRNDGGLIGIIAAHGLPKEEVSKLRETLATGLTKVDRAGVGQRLTRVRLIAEGNPWKLPIDECGPTRYDALKFFVLTEGHADRARWDFGFVFKREDVPPEVVTQAEAGRTGKFEVARAIPAEVFRRKVKAAWSIRPEDVMFDEDVINRIADLAAEYQRKYQFSGLITNEFYKTVMKYTIALALLVNSISVEEKRLKVRVKSKHLKWMREYIDDWLLDLEAHMAEERETIDLTTVDDDYLYVLNPEYPSRRAVFEAILKSREGVIRNKDVAEKLGFTIHKVSKVVRGMYDRKIVDRTSKGYRLTRVGNEIAKRLINEKPRKQELEKSELWEQEDLK